MTPMKYRRKRCIEHQNYDVFLINIFCLEFDIYKFMLLYLTHATLLTMRNGIILNISDILLIIQCIYIVETLNFNLLHNSINLKALAYFLQLHFCKKLASKSLIYYTFKQKDI